jgi:hypothetical protein
MRPADGHAPAWLENAVFGLDRRLRRRHGVYEYSSDPDCIFRIQHMRSQHDIVLRDGTRIARGAPLIGLHLWNEQVPAIGPQGPTVAWARQFGRAVDNSLRTLAHYLADHPEYNDVAAIVADVRLGTAAQNLQLSRRFGFEQVDCVAADTRVLHRFGENLLLLLLVLATNPATLSASVLRRDHKLVYLSRGKLERRYRVTWRRPSLSESLQPC